MKNLKIGVVGVGNMGSAHAECIYNSEIPGMTLFALCDTDVYKRRTLSEKYPGIPVFPNHEAMLSSATVDCVIIATPHRFHPPIAEDALRAGVHVLSEKPAGVDSGTVRKLCSVARESGMTYGIMFNQRTDPLYKKARELVRNGQIGFPKRLVWIITNWYRTQAYYDSGLWRGTWDGEGDGVLINQAPHNLDIWQWIFGMPNRVRAFCHNGKYHNIPVEDDVTIYAEYENEATATFIATTGEYPGTNRLEISGDRGKIVIEHGRLTFYELSESERDYCFNSVGSPLPSVTVTEYKEKSVVSGHRMILSNFAAHIINGDELISPGYEGLNELMISNAAYLSTWTDDWVDIPFDEEKFSVMLADLTKKAAVKKQISVAESSEKEYLDRWKVQW